MKIKILTISILASCLFFVTCFFATAASAATTIYFNPSTVSPQSGANIQTDLVVDVVGTSAFSADVTINIPAEITVKSVTNGGYFDTLLFPVDSQQNPIVANGHLELHGYFSDPSRAITGIGNLAHLTLTSTKVLGSSILTFQCDGSGNDTGIIGGGGTNILACSSISNNKFTLTYPNSTPTPTPGNNNGGPTNPPTNACGGTCGSNYNCNSGLYCPPGVGFCRNPDCISSANCVCATSTPTPKPTIKSTPRPSGKPTPRVIALATTTPYPTPKASGLATPTSQSTSSSAIKPNFLSLAVWSGLGLVAVIVIIIAINSLTKKNPPQINPPTESYPIQPPSDVPPPTGF